MRSIIVLFKYSLFLNRSDPITKYFAAFGKDASFVSDIINCALRLDSNGAIEKNYFKREIMYLCRGQQDVAFFVGNFRGFFTSRLQRTDVGMHMHR